MSRSMSSASVVHEMWPDGGDLVRPNVGSIGLAADHAVLARYPRICSMGMGGLKQPGGNI